MVKNKNSKIKEKMKRRNGITLIALVITIIVFGVRIDIWTHLMRGCIINYVH